MTFINPKAIINISQNRREMNNMKSILCDFSDRKDHSKNLLKYKYNLDVEKSLIRFLRELFVDIDIPDDEEFLEKCDIFKIKLSNMIYNLIAFVQFKYTTNLHLSDNYNFKSTLLATKYNHEHLSQNDVNELKSKTYSIDEVNDAIKNFICKELPYGYKPYKELKKLLETKMEVYLYRKHIKDKISAYKLYKYIYEIINIELDLDYGIDKERIPDSIQEEDIRQIMNDIDTAEYYIEKNECKYNDVHINHNSDKQTSFLDDYSSLLKENRLDPVDALIKDIHFESYYSSVMPNILQIELCKSRYNKYEQYTKSSLSNVYNNEDVKNRLYKGFKNTNIKRMLMNEKAIGSKKRECYIPFAAIDLTAMHTTLLTKYSIRKVLSYFQEYIFNGEKTFKDIIDLALDNKDYNLSINDVKYVVKDINEYDNNYLTDEDCNDIFYILDKYIKRHKREQKKGTQLQISIQNILESNKETNNKDYEKLLAIVKKIFKNNSELDEYDLYNVSVVKLQYSIVKNAYYIRLFEEFQKADSKESPEEKLLLEIYSNTASYMIERIYGINLCEVFYKKASIYNNNEMADILLNLMKVQNVYIREALLNVYLSDPSQKDTVLKSAKYESEWVYPIIMYFIQVFLELYTNKLKDSLNAIILQKNDSENEDTKLNDLLHKVLNDDSYIDTIKEHIKNTEKNKDDFNNICTDIVLINISNAFKQGNIHALKFNNNDYVYSASSSSGTIGIKKDHSAVAEIFYKKLMKCYETPESRKESFECFKLKHGFLDPYYDDNFFK